MIWTGLEIGDVFDEIAADADRCYASLFAAIGCDEVVDWLISELDGDDGS